MLLSTSSRHGKEKGHILLDYFEGIETKNKEQKLKSEVTHLAKLRDKLKFRANLLTEEINEQTKIIPTSLDHINLMSSINPSDLKENEDGVDGFIDAQKIEAYQHIFGVKIASRDSETIAFDLQITTNGFVSNDVYQVTLKRNNPGFTLNGAILPAPASLDPKTYNFDSVRNSAAKVNTDKMTVIPIRNIADEQLPKVDKFIKEVKKHLCAYISRYNQLVLLSEKFDKNEVHGIEYNTDLTEIKFALVIGDSNSDGFNLHLALQYDHGEQRPKKESLKMKLSGQQRDYLDSDAIAEIKNQIAYFYSYPLIEAIQHAFL